MVHRDPGVVMSCACSCPSRRAAPSCCPQKPFSSFLPSPRGSVQELWPNTVLAHPKSELHLFQGSNAKRDFDSGCPPLPFHRVWVRWQRLQAQCRRGASPGASRAPPMHP